MLKFETTTAHEALNGEHRELVTLIDLTGCVQDRCTVHGDSVVRDELHCLRLRARKTADHECLVDAVRARHALGTEHEVGETRQIVEHAVWCNRSIIW